MTRLSWLLACEGAVALAAVACNSVWGVDRLSYGGSAPSTTSGGVGGAAGTGGATGGAPNGGQGGVVAHPSVRWCKGFGDPSAQSAAGVGVAPNGDIALTGNYDGLPSFGNGPGGGPPPVAGAQSLYVVKLDPLGAPIWSAFPSNDDETWATGVAIDGAGEVAAVGFYMGTLAFSGAALTTATAFDVYAAKFVTGPTPAWSSWFGPDPGVQRAFGVALDGLGNLIVAGGYDGSVTIGTDHWTTVSDDDVFVAKLAATDGAPTWTRRFWDVGPSDVEELPEAVALDSAGAPVIAGHLRGPMQEPQGHTFPATGGDDAFVIKLDSSGGFAWGYAFGDVAGATCDVPTGGCDQYPMAVAVDALGNVVVAGWFRTSIDFGTPSSQLLSLGGTDVFVAKLDAAGNTLWARGFGGAADQRATGVAFDAAGNVILSGDFQGTVDFGAGPLTSAGANDVFLLELDPSGNLLWAKSFGDSMEQANSHVATGPGNSIVLFGEVTGSIAFDSCSVTSAGATDLFLAVLDP